MKVATKRYVCVCVGGGGGGGGGRGGRGGEGEGGEELKVVIRLIYTCNCKCCVV